MDVKHCARCDQDKPLDDFNKSARGSQGRQRYCRKCQHEYYKADAPRRIAEVAAKRIRYGMTVEEIAEFRKRNDGLCELCHERPGSRVDHDHLTGAVRGHLCNQCNVALGLFQDRVELLELAIQYLRR